MGIESDSELNEFLSSKYRSGDKAEILSTKGYSVYEKRFGKPKFDYTPYCVWFYYLRVNEDGRLAIDHYFYADGTDIEDPKTWQPISPGRLPAIIQRLTINGRPRTTQKFPPKLEDHNFNNIIWDRKSYIAFVLDEANWKLHTDGSGHAAVYFNTDKGSAPNFSFFDAEDLVVEIDNDDGTTDRRPAFFMINHMKRNSAGDDVKEELIEYKFDIYARAKFAVTDPRMLTVVLDPPGGNQGPPELP